MELQQVFNPVKLYFQCFVPNQHDTSLPPIICLHGAGALHSSWNKVGKKIANKTNRQLYALDLRNHGESGWSDCFCLDAHVADLEHFLALKCIKKCTFIGHSLGGKIALYLAMRKPEYVEKIIVEEIMLSDPPEYEISLAINFLNSIRNISFLPKGLSEGDVRNFLARVAKERYPEQPDIAFHTPLRKNYDGSFQFDFNVDVMERTFKDKSAYKIDYSKCKKYTGPILSLCSENGRVKMYEDALMKEYFPAIEFYNFKTQAHLLHVDRPDEFVEEVSEFINKM